MKMIVAVVSVLAIVLSLAACGRVETGNETSDNAYAAFVAIVNQNKDKLGFHSEKMHWGLELQEDKFEWSKDSSAHQLDFAMALQAQPFIDAGLDVSKLEDSGYVFIPGAEADGMKTPDLIAHPYDVSDKKETAQGFEDAMRRLLKQDPSLVSYNQEEKYYALHLSDGYVVRWTEELGLNDADMTFVIAADPLVAAGLDAAKMEGSGWAFHAAGEATPNQLVRSYKLT